MAATGPAPGWGWVLVLAALLSGGCAVGPPLGPPLSSAPVELTAVPFFPQRDYLCGPAALATVLGASGQSVHPDDLTDALYLPARHGTLQVELTAAARSRGRLAVALDGTLSGLVQQLEAGRPVLVLQNLASRLLPRWHYAVVVGYLPEPDRMVLRSGRQERLLVSRRRFAATWQRADNWSLVLLTPGEPPGGLPAGAFLKAAAALETTGAHRQALAAFAAAAETWPGDPTAALGMANNHYYLGDLDAAAAGYRRVLELQPGDPVALHNLVSTELERGRWCAARDVLVAPAPAGAQAHALVADARRALAEAEPADSTCDAGAGR